ncbi:MAG: glycosyltransferase family 2 protein [Acidobacteria bacterium]|nr:MAG: glycosyltransferase family 2 protein [Acidobacteriota bacterium]
MLAQFSQRSISVFFPAFNDEQTISSLVGTALEVLPELTNDYEVLVINDGSRDGTAQIIDKLAEAFPKVRAIHHPNNLGYGAALRSGFRHATKELVFYTDGDGQYDVRELRRLVPLMTDAVDVVNGYKLRRADSRSRRVVGELYNRVARKIFQLPIRDVDCDFRLIRRRALRAIGDLPNSGAACVQLVRKLDSSDAAFAEVAVNHYPRLHGKSQFFTVTNVTRTLIDFSFFAAQACIAGLVFFVGDIY